MIKESSVSLADQAYERLEKMIITLELKPGKIVSVNEISQSLGIGRMPIREAFKRLENTGLVSIISRTGVIIKEITTEDIFLQMEVRSVLEPLIVKRACKYINGEEKEYILKLIDEFKHATQNDDRMAAIEIDEKFNKLLMKSSKNSFAACSIAPLYAMEQRIYFLNYESELTNEINRSHIELMHMIVSGDVDKAIETVNYIFKCTEKILRSKMESWLPNQDISEYQA